MPAPRALSRSASIVSASLTTGEALVDNELKGAAFFNVEVSPVIAFIADPDGYFIELIGKKPAA